MTMFHSRSQFACTRGFVVPFVYWLIFGLGMGGGMSLPVIKARFGIVDPKAQRIVDLQNQVQAKDGQIKDAQDTKDGAVKTAKQAIVDSAQIAHQEVHGAAVELAKPSPDLDTVKTLVNHADDSLTRIFGALSPEQIAEMNAIIDARAAGKIAVANALLDEKDKELTSLLAANKTAETTIAAKTELITSLQVEKATTVTKLNTVTADVLAKEQTLVAKARELTGWGAWWTNVKFYLYLAVALYLFVHFLMPSIDDELDHHYPASGVVPMWVKGFHTLYNLLKTFTCAH